MYRKRQNLISVSYTHLDVYKRQAYYVVKVECKNMEIKNKDGEKGNLKSGMAAQAKIVVDDDSAVSYTHLDVYKRQAL